MDIVYCLLLGFPTWTLVDGTWSMLSQLAERLPEGYGLSAYLVLALSLGNVFPLLLGASFKSFISSVSVIIKIILLLGFTIGMLLSIFWSTTIEISGSTISLPLYILFFFAGACASSSNVTHYAYVSSYRPLCTTSMATGMALGSMTTGFLAIIQANTSGFSVGLYFALLSATFILGGLGLCCLLFLPPMDLPSNCSTPEYVKNSMLLADDHDIKDQDINVQEEGIWRSPQHSLQANSLLGLDESSTIKVDYSLYRGILILLLINAFLGYGVIPSLISSICSRFQAKELVLLYATSLASIMDAVGRASTAILRINTELHFRRATFMLLAIAVFLVVLLLLEDSPQNSWIFRSAYGGILPVSLYACFVTGFGYANTCIFRYVKDRNELSPAAVQQMYTYCGVATQSGALIGSLLTFSLVISGAFS